MLARIQGGKTNPLATLTASHPRKPQRGGLLTAFSIAALKFRLRQGGLGLLPWVGVFSNADAAVVVGATGDRVEEAEHAGDADPG